MNAAKLRKQLGRLPGQCTWCGQSVGPGRRTWCSPACVEAFRQQHQWAYIRGSVWARDHGRCARCGCDTTRIQRLVNQIRKREGYKTFLYLETFYRSIGHHDVYCRDQWEAHHRVARMAGGNNGLENLETLCLECHKAETRQQRRKQA